MLRQSLQEFFPPRKFTWCVGLQGDSSLINFKPALHVGDIVLDIAFDSARAVKRQSSIDMRIPMGEGSCGVLCVHV